MVMASRTAEALWMEIACCCCCRSIGWKNDFLLSSGVVEGDGVVLVEGVVCGVGVVAGEAVVSANQWG